MCRACPHHHQLSFRVQASERTHSGLVLLLGRKLTYQSTTSPAFAIAAESAAWPFASVRTVLRSQRLLSPDVPGGGCLWEWRPSCSYDDLHVCGSNTSIRTVLVLLLLSRACPTLHCSASFRTIPYGHLLCRRHASFLSAAGGECLPELGPSPRHVRPSIQP